MSGSLGRLALELKPEPGRESFKISVTHFVVRDRLKADPMTGCGMPTDHMVCTAFLSIDELDCPACQVEYVARALRADDQA